MSGEGRIGLRLRSANDAGDGSHRIGEWIFRAWEAPVAAVETDWLSDGNSRSFAS